MWRTAVGGLDAEEQHDQRDVQRSVADEALVAAHVVVSEILLNFISISIPFICVELQREEVKRNSICSPHGVGLHLALGLFSLTFILLVIFVFVLLFLRAAAVIRARTRRE